MKPAIILHHNKLEIKQLPMWANRTSGLPVKNDFTNLCSNISSGLHKERENDHIFWVSQIILCVSPANLLYFKTALFSQLGLFLECRLQWGALCAGCWSCGCSEGPPWSCEIVSRPRGRSDTCLFWFWTPV